MLTLVSNYRNFGSASPSFRLSSCAHTAEFSFYAQKEFNMSWNTVICTQNTRKHRTLHRNSIQGEESNLQQNPSNHKQGIQNTASFRLKSSTHTHAPSSLARPKRVGMASNLTRRAPKTERERMRKGNTTMQLIKWQDRFGSSRQRPIVKRLKTKKRVSL